MLVFMCRHQIASTSIGGSVITWAGGSTAAAVTRIILAIIVLVRGLCAKIVRTPCNHLCPMSRN
jgi:hypothetical protein